MKLSCNVTQDLLPLYHDGVCSEESRTLVAEHLGQCEACKKIMDDLNAAPAPEAHVDDAAALKALKKQWGKSLAKSFAKGLTLACLVFGVLYGAWFGLTQWSIVSVSAEALNIHDVSRLSSGQVVFAIDTADEKVIREIRTNYDLSGDEVVLYITPKRPILAEKVGVTERFHNKHMVDPEKSGVWDYKGGYVELSRIYVGPKGDGVLLWEKGMELPAASPEMEEYFSAEWASFMSFY